jgi:hypothetical protein
MINVREKTFMTEEERRISAGGQSALPNPKGFGGRIGQTILKRAKAR